jgi:hypothetical protein
MSYDLYCYRSLTGRPDKEEAQAIIDAAEEEAENIEIDIDLQQRILAALLLVNPRLEQFDFDYKAIAAATQISEEEAKIQFSYIELNTPEEDLVSQITIRSNHVFISVPYWYQGKEARDVFDLVAAYTRAIAETAGYFVYDPQTDQSYDPTRENFMGLSLYTGVMLNNSNPSSVPVETSDKRKPWWKFW